MNFCLFLVLVSKSKIQHKERLSEGQESEIQNFPYLAQVFTWPKGPFCGGSIIAQNYVLTSASCVCGTSNPTLYRVRTGSSFKDRDGKLSEIARIICYEENTKMHSVGPRKTYKHDIAILELKKNLTFDDTTSQIKLAEEDPKFESYALISGWGSTENFKWPKQFLTAKVHIIDNEECEPYNNNGEFENYICAKYQETYPCLGDAGDPLVVEEKLVGIVMQKSTLCAMATMPSFYTSVARYRNWIESKIEDRGR